MVRVDLEQSREQQREPENRSSNECIKVDPLSYSVSSFNSSSILSKSEILVRYHYASVFDSNYCTPFFTICVDHN